MVMPSCESSDSAKSVYLSTEYHYRNLSYILLASASACGFLLLTAMAIAYPVKVAFGEADFSISGIFIFDCVGPIVAIAFFIVAKRSLGNVLRDKRLSIEISSLGIQIGSSSYPWELVGWIGGKRAYPFASRLNLVFAYPGEEGILIWVPTNESYSRESFHALMTKLDSVDVDLGTIVASSRQVMFVHW